MSIGLVDLSLMSIPGSNPPAIHKQQEIPSPTEIPAIYSQPSDLVDMLDTKKNYYKMRFICRYQHKNFTIRNRFYIKIKS